MRQEIKKNDQTKKKSKKVMYSGNIRLKIENAEDYIQVNRFCETLKVLSNMCIVSHNWSEKEGLDTGVSLKALKVSANLSRATRAASLVSRCPCNKMRKG